jgi:hypothetical protein
MFTVSLSLYCPTLLLSPVGLAEKNEKNAKEQKHENAIRTLVRQQPPLLDMTLNTHPPAILSSLKTEIDLELPDQSPVSSPPLFQILTQNEGQGHHFHQNLCVYITGVKGIHDAYFSGRIVFHNQKEQVTSVAIAVQNDLSYTSSCEQR